jgi:conjugative relaxase-like TrwC/TraI family protein
VLGLRGQVEEKDFARVLAGRDPSTGGRLITAQGSAGRRPDLGVGSETLRAPDGQLLYGLEDTAAQLHLPKEQVARMFQVGAAMALSRLAPSRDGIADQPEGSYLVPFVDRDGTVLATSAELARCQDALHLGTSGDAVAALGRPDDQLPLAEAARLAGVTRQYLQKLVKGYETNKATIDDLVAAGSKPRHAYLVASRGTKRRWLVRRSDLAAYLDRRRPPAVRVGYDLTLTTEKSLGVLALLSDDDTRRTVLGAVRVGNDWAMDWLEHHAAAARTDDKVIPVRGWTVASFQHLTSRALDPFPHHHNVVANTVEDHSGVRRALDARALYRDAKAASALATAEMRYQLTRRLGVSWRPSPHGGWEIAGIPDGVLREFSQRRNEIEDALRELEEVIGRGTSLEEVDQVVLSTRPAKQQALVDDLVDSWWQRAGRLGFGRNDLVACIGPPVEPPEPEPEAVFAALAAPEGICANLSIFNRGDLLTALANLPLPQPSDADDADRDGPAQPVIVPAAQLEELADGFLACDQVVQLTPANAESPARYSTREMLAVQDRIVARYRTGLHKGAAQVRSDLLDKALGRHPGMTDEQGALVRAFCTSGHRIQAAIGYPGAGKTTSMATARDAWQAAGWRVVGAAVKGEAARTLGATAGIPTETLAWYLAHHDPLTAPLDARTVLIVDEASTISDRDLDRLGWLAGATGATLRLIGDPAQHGAVEAGGMFRVLCERHPTHTPQLTHTHRLKDPADLAAATYLREGKVEQALAALERAGHLHVVDDELQGYVQVLARWWSAQQAGQHHPMVDRRNSVRRALNRLAHQLLRAAGDVGQEELVASGGRRYSVGDRVIARTPNRDLHPPGAPQSYVRNGAAGTITALHHGGGTDDDQLTVAFDGLGTIDVPRSFFDDHEVAPGRRIVGLDHAYALTSYAVTGATHAVSTSRIDPTASRAETYVNITRGQQANHLYLVQPPDPLDGERLPRTPPDPIDEAITHQLTTSIGERTAWEIREDMRGRSSDRGRRIER